MSRARTGVVVVVCGAIGTLAVSALASLIGLNPTPPQVFFDNQGTTSYAASTGAFSVTGTPLLARFVVGGPPRLIVPTGDPPARFVAISIVLGDDGSVFGGASGDDLQVVGAVDQNGDGSIDYQGLLLSGEIAQFGHLDTSPPFQLFLGQAGTDVYDLRFTVSGGSMAGLFGDQDIGVVVTSDRSTFEGDFTESFAGKAKGTIGAVPPMAKGGGACCLPDGSCNENLSQGECDAAGGIYQGDFTVCVKVFCEPVKGACCFPDGSCAVVTQPECDDGSGDYQGDASICPEVICPPAFGACCFDDGSCDELDQDECAQAGGLFQGPLTDCDKAQCVALQEGCCFEDGTCAVLPVDLCEDLGGDPQGPDSDCKPNRCPEPGGACCLDDGSCLVLTELECIDLAGYFQGPLTTCQNAECIEPKGACCLPSGQCIVREQDECKALGGDYHGDNTICVGNPCG